MLTQEISSGIIKWKNRIAIMVHDKVHLSMKDTLKQAI